ncbi:CDP-glycerol glycerophosphotransferase family protein [Niallia circulans]|uniref:CDP-glycerol glycerophosphotransferase family protein n=1 Tax=Niallia circulans TaxID=1397 RepID=UPI00203B0DA2|nr:CDP-glycerol glycerophosphotransferase family protein [Niallia circulans]MCM2981960.1 CDP-glycerol glycerophosphotransferase family protein [Niallia circulans]
MKLNIIIFGTGSSSEKLLEILDFAKVNIIGFSDNNESKHNLTFRNHVVFSASEIVKRNFDYVVIASQFSSEIYSQLLDMGIHHKKIVPMDIAVHHYNMTKNYNEILKSITLDNKPNGRKIKIGIINYNYSNYNGYALYKYMPIEFKGKYDVSLIEEKNVGELMGFDVLCSSHFDGLYDGSHINIEMWHGFPLKKMGYLQESGVTEDLINHIKQRSDQIQLIMSYSQLYSTFFNSCFPTNSNKYKITGMPRNDLLFEKNSLGKLEKVVEQNLDFANIVFYLPTWRKGKNSQVETNKEWKKLIGFKDESKKKLIKMLEEKNLFLIVKLHPYEYNQFKDLEIFKEKRIFLLSEDILKMNKIHLYELLGCGKLLITDYSSIFFDTLLIDLPVIFAPTDLDEYTENRGFMLEPYQYFTPGPTVNSFEELKSNIYSLIDGIDPYIDHRERIRNLVFKFLDNKASQRVWDSIDEYLMAKSL